MRTVLHTLILWEQNIYSEQILSLPISVPTSFSLTVWLLLFSAIVLFVFYSINSK